MAVLKAAAPAAAVPTVVGPTVTAAAPNVAAAAAGIALEMRVRPTGRPVARAMVAQLTVTEMEGPAAATAPAVHVAAARKTLSKY